MHAYNIADLISFNLFLPRSTIFNLDKLIVDEKRKMT